MKYKVVETLHGQFVGEPKNTVLFEGSLDSLNTQFPLSKISGADPFDHNEIEEGYVQWDYTFFESKDGENWNECEDPRTYSDRDLTDFEREIDKENRRLFPGDYYHEEEDDYDCVEDWWDDDLDD